jgi:hypothetical protein
MSPHLSTAGARSLTHERNVNVFRFVLNGISYNATVHRCDE